MLYCSKCGTELRSQAVFCRECGTTVSSAMPSEPSQEISRPAHSGKDDVKFFVGQNYEYIKQKWEIAAQKKENSLWNWAAFLMGFMWMAYRKMYVYSVIFIGAIVVEDLLEYALDFRS